MDTVELKQKYAETLKVLDQITPLVQDIYLSLQEQGISKEDCRHFIIASLNICEIAAKVSSIMKSENWTEVK